VRASESGGSFADGAPLVKPATSKDMVNGMFRRLRRSQRCCTAIMPNKAWPRLKKEGRTPGPEKRIDPARLKALRNEGKPIWEIMREVAASKASVYRALRQAEALDTRRAL
jgi:hypothetical protein